MSQLQSHPELSKTAESGELRSRVDTIVMHHASLDSRVTRLEKDMKELIGGFQEIKSLVTKTYDRVNAQVYDFWDRVYKYLMIGYIIGSVVYVSMIYGDIINAATLANNWHTTVTKPE